MLRRGLGSTPIPSAHDCLNRKGGQIRALTLWSSSFEFTYSYSVVLQLKYYPGSEVSSIDNHAHKVEVREKMVPQYLGDAKSSVKCGMVVT